jgi:hypothetical protein
MRSRNSTPYLGGFAWPGRITKPCDAAIGETPAPLPNLSRQEPDLGGDLVVAPAAQTSQHDAGSLSQTDFATSTSGQPFELCHSFRLTR